MNRWRSSVGISASFAIVRLPRLALDRLHNVLATNGTAVLVDDDRQSASIPRLDRVGVVNPHLPQDVLSAADLRAGARHAVWVADPPELGDSRLLESGELCWQHGVSFRHARTGPQRHAPPAGKKRRAIGAPSLDRRPGLDLFSVGGLGHFQANRPARRQGQVGVVATRGVLLNRGTGDPGDQSAAAASSGNTPKSVRPGPADQAPSPPLPHRADLPRFDCGLGSASPSECLQVQRRTRPNTGDEVLAGLGTVGKAEDRSATTGLRSSGPRDDVPHDRDRPEWTPRPVVSLRRAEGMGAERSRRADGSPGASTSRTYTAERRGDSGIGIQPTADRERNYRPGCPEPSFSLCRKGRSGGLRFRCNRLAVVRPRSHSQPSTSSATCGGAFGSSGCLEGLPLRPLAHSTSDLMRLANAKPTKSRYSRWEIVAQEPTTSGLRPARQCRSAPQPLSDIPSVRGSVMASEPTAGNRDISGSGSLRGGTSWSATTEMPSTATSFGRPCWPCSTRSPTSGCWTWAAATAVWLRRLAERGVRVVAVDQAEAFIREAQARPHPNIEFRVVGATDRATRPRRAWPASVERVLRVLPDQHVNQAHRRQLG